LASFELGAVSLALVGGSTGDLPVSTGLGLLVVALEAVDGAAESPLPVELAVALEVWRPFRALLELVDEVAHVAGETPRKWQNRVVDRENPATRALTASGLRGNGLRGLRGVDDVTGIRRARVHCVTSLHLLLVSFF